MGPLAAALHLRPGARFCRRLCARRPIGTPAVASAPPATAPAPAKSANPASVPPGREFTEAAVGDGKHGAAGTCPERQPRDARPGQARSGRAAERPGSPSEKAAAGRRRRCGDCAGTAARPLDAGRCARVRRRPGAGTDADDDPGSGARHASRPHHARRLRRRGTAPGYHHRTTQPVADGRPEAERRRRRGAHRRHRRRHPAAPAAAAGVGRNADRRLAARRRPGIPRRPAGRHHAAHVAASRRGPACGSPRTRGLSELVVIGPGGWRPASACGGVVGADKREKRIWKQFSRSKTAPGSAARPPARKGRPAGKSCSTPA